MSVVSTNRALAGACLGAAMLLAPAKLPAGAPDAATTNTALVRGAFEDWRQGRGSVFDLLHDDVTWTVAGTSPVSGTYTSRQDFLDLAVPPINAQLATPIIPEVQHVVAHGDAVVVIWEGRATSRSGFEYTNHYAWHMQLREGKVVRVNAFLDTWALQALME